jgi:hypothetical protein
VTWLVVVLDGDDDFTSAEERVYLTLEPVFLPNPSHGF